MSNNPTLAIPPVADPNFPPTLTNGGEPTVTVSNVFTEAELNFMQSVLWYWEENSPEARPFESTDPQADGYDPNLQMLTSVRAKLAALVPTA